MKVGDKVVVISDFFPNGRKGIVREVDENGDCVRYDLLVQEMTYHLDLSEEDCAEMEKSLDFLQSLLRRAKSQ